MYICTTIQFCLFDLYLLLVAGHFDRTRATTPETASSTSNSASTGQTIIKTPTTTIKKIMGPPITTDESSRSKFDHNDDNVNNDIRIVFSDVDGTLVHYPSSDSSLLKDDDDDDDDGGNLINPILKLPASATGMRGIISSKTLIQCQKIRQGDGGNVKLVLVSGMRTSTLLKRLPYLPVADAYCSEAGGRIFYNRNRNQQQQQQQQQEKNAKEDQSKIPFITVTPKPYRSGDGPSNNNMITPESFDLVEDMEWRNKMQAQKAAGRDGYIGSELLELIQEQQQSSSSSTITPATSTLPSPVAIKDRVGALWDYANQLMEKGYVLDTKGYASCFRVNRKQQTTISKEEFDALLRGEGSSSSSSPLKLPPELGTSVNLGCIDYYPIQSGKKNCCRYLAGKFLLKNAGGVTTESSEEEDLHNNNLNNLLSTHCVCLCDDDNDLEMAMAVQHAYIPGISSKSMGDIIANNPKHFTQTGGGIGGLAAEAEAADSDAAAASNHDHHESAIEGTIATEKALSLVLERIVESDNNKNKKRKRE